MINLTHYMSVFIIRCMNFSRYGFRTSYMICSLIFFTISSLESAQATSWDTEGASRAYEEASRMRSDIDKSTQFHLSQYRRCAEAYREVYLKDPHHGRAGEAIYEEGRIYEEMGDKSNDLSYYRTAAKMYLFLIKDYAGNHNCPEALLRLGNLYAEHLNDEDAAQDVYRRLISRYKNSNAARRLAEQKAVAATSAAEGKALISAPKSLHQNIIPESSLRIQETDTIPAGLPSAAVAAFVRSIRHWSATDHTRVVIDMDKETRYEETRLRNPDRIYFDIHNARLSEDLPNRAVTVGDTFLKQVRLAQNRPDVVRVVLDCMSIGGYSVSKLQSPFRIVVDLKAAPEANSKTNGLSLESEPAPLKIASPRPGSSIHIEEKPATLPVSPGTEQTDDSSNPLFATKLRLPPRAVTEINSPSPGDTAAGAESISSKIALPKSRGNSAGAILVPPQAVSLKPEVMVKAAVPTSRGSRTLTRMLGLKIGRIVIDPGHGGDDLGTIGPGGLIEKDLVLSLARSLKKMLQENLGAEVFLTRDSDVFVSLEERTATANRLQADLFISIHANASSSRSTSGVETYYLDFARTESDREVAARENAPTANSVSNLEDLVKKIAQADKSAESRELASIIQKRLYSGVRTLFHSPRNRGVRTAPFIVLIGAKMPSVLTEVAFISNPKDEKLLKKEVNQEVLVKALFSGIEGYMETLGSSIAQNRTHPN